jgi:hypothetical protein
MTARVLALLFFIVFCSQAGPACTCASLGPQPCHGLTATDVVFVGTVLDIENPPLDDGRAGGSGLSRYHFKIDEHIAGTESREIDIYSGRGGADCSYHFKQGRQYLVFPYRERDSRLFATICSPTRPVEDAQAILPQLRAMRDRQRVASVYGILRSAQQPYTMVSDDLLGQVLSNTRIELRSKDETFEAVTDSNGAYAFYDMPQGEYHFEGELPQHLEFAQVILGGPLPPLKLPARACFESDLTALPSGRIQGRVLASDGKPLAFAAVDLFRRDKYSAETTNGGWYEAQDRDKGYFEFQNVGPGDYLLVYNNSGRMDADEPYPRTFYPGVADLRNAKIIHLEAGQRLDDADIRVQGGLPTREITVRLVAETGELPDINYVEGKGSDGQSTTEQEISAGVYSISILKGVRYDFRGQGYCSATDQESTTESVEVDGSNDRATELTLTFRGAGCPRKSTRR